ncbi:MAG: LysE family translocator [Neomegalonema sp.]
MPFDVWLAYVATILIFMCTPGPSQLLMLSNSMAHGVDRAWATMAGDLTANSLQILAAGLGLAAVVMASQTAFLVVKWAGVAYLIWLGVKQILRASGHRLGLGDGPRKRLRALWLQGFLTSAANPKAVVFFAALMPQFMDPSLPLAPQLFILGITYLAFDGAFLTAYGLSADWFAKRFSGEARLWAERAAGGFLIGAAVLLGLKSVER